MKEIVCFISSSGQACTLESWGFPIFKVWTGIYDHCSMQCTMQAPQQYTAAAAVTERGALLYTGAGASMPTLLYLNFKLMTFFKPN